MQRPMSYDEKWQLSRSIRKLRGTELARVVDIVLAGESMHVENRDEIEFDFEAFQPSTLRKLEAFVVFCRQNKSRKLRAARKRAPESPLSLYEIQQLKLDIKRLGENKLEDVLDIIFGALKPRSLIQLQAHIAACLQKKQRESYTPRNKATGSQWSLEEKRQLISDVYKLHGYELERVINIMRSEEPSLRDMNPEDMEVDYATLQPSTLTKIYTYIASLRDKPRQLNDAENANSEVDNSPCNPSTSAEEPH